MKKENSIWDLYISGIIICLGGLFLLFPLLNITDLNLVYRIFLGTLSILSIIRFFKHWQSKEYSSYFLFFISMLLFICSFLWNLTATPKIFALSLLSWVLFASFAILKRADFFHDRKSKIWCLEVALLICFFLGGILTCANFAFNTETSILLLGYFCFMYGVLELQQNLMIYLTKGKIK